MKFFGAVFAIVVVLSTQTAGNETSEFETNLREALELARVKLGITNTTQLTSLDSLTDGVPFNCPSLTYTEATNVNELAPYNIKVVGALGDSITAAMGAKANNIIEDLLSYRGVSWSIGGDDTLDTVTTLPNIIRKYTSSVTGYSETTLFDTKKRLNVAVVGAIAQDMPGQAKSLVDKIKSDKNINVDTDWKLVTLWIGGNNLCAYCNNKDKHSSENYVNSIKEALDTLHAELPRTFVNLVQIIDITRLAPLKGLTCEIVHGFVCKCAEDEETSTMSTIYQQKLNDLISTGRYETKDDFTVVLQPFFEGVQLPRHEDGTPDKTYFAPDCFHFSTKGHMEAAKALWQNMFEPVGGKTSGWDLGGPLYCPSESNKYFYTKVNSPPPSLFEGAYDGTSDGDTGDHVGSAAVTATSIVMGSLVALMIIIIVIVAIIYKIRKRQ